MWWAHNQYPAPNPVPGDGKVGWVSADLPYTVPESFDLEITDVVFSSKQIITRNSYLVLARSDDGTFPPTGSPGVWSAPSLLGAGPK